MGQKPVPPRQGKRTNQLSPPFNIIHFSLPPSLKQAHHSPICHTNSPAQPRRPSFPFPRRSQNHPVSLPARDRPCCLARAMGLRLCRCPQTRLRSGSCRAGPPGPGVAARRRSQGLRRRGVVVGSRWCRCLGWFGRPGPVGWRGVFNEGSLVMRRGSTYLLAGAGGFG